MKPKELEKRINEMQIETTRGKEIIKKLNKEVQVCDMMMRQMEKEKK